VYDPSLLSGWSKRGYNWELGLGVQHELMPRVSIEASYYRRWFGNFILTDNLTLSAADYDTFSITAPLDPALPNGGGQVISGLLDLKPARFGLPSNNIVKLASDYGQQKQYWHGVDLTVNARPRGGVMLQGGLSTGRTVNDNCDIVKTVPESIALTNIAYCHTATGWVGGTQLKFLGSYSIPKVDVRISGTYQSLPGPALVANYTATNAAVTPSLGPSAGWGRRQRDRERHRAWHGLRRSPEPGRLARVEDLPGESVEVHVQLRHLQPVERGHGADRESCVRVVPQANQYSAGAADQVRLPGRLLGRVDS
jgi:hypothetical protein